MHAKKKDERIKQECCKIYTIINENKELILVRKPLKLEDFSLNKKLI